MEDDYNYNSDNMDDSQNASEGDFMSQSNEDESVVSKENQDKNSQQDEDEDFQEQQQVEQRDHQIIEDINEDIEPNKQRITSPFLTKYEKARIIGVRAVQISKNAPLYYSPGDNQNLDPLAIAQQELQDGKIPFIVRRYLPDGTCEDWKLSQLKRFD